MNSIHQKSKYHNRIDNLTDGNNALDFSSIFKHEPQAYSQVDAVLNTYEPLGLQVIPLPAHKKYPHFKWTHLTYASAFLHWNDSHDSKRAATIAFHGDCNLAFITGDVSNNVIAIDADTEHDFQKLKRAFYRAGIRTRIHKSSKGGHILLRCDTRLANAKITSTSGTTLVDILAHNRLAVLPGSTKKLRDGSIFIYSVDRDSTDTIADIDFDTLQRILSSVYPSFTLARRKQRKNIKASTRNFIDNGAPVGQRNNELFTATSDMLKYNTIDYTRQFMTTIADRHIPEENEQNRRTIESAIQNHNPAIKQASIEELALQALSALTFVGRAGATQKAIFIALAKRAGQEHGKSEFVATYRQLQELSNIVTRTSIKNALDNLCERGVLERIESKSHRSPSTWRFNRKELTRLSACCATRVDDSFDNEKVGHKQTNSLTTKNVIYYGSIVSDFDAKHGERYENYLRTSSGLGNTGTDIYLYILNHHAGARVSEIADALNLTTRTVRRHANKLVLHQLASRDGYTITARYNATQIAYFCAISGAKDTYIKYQENTRQERLWYAIDTVCIGRISTDKTHPMSVKRTRFTRQFISDSEQPKQAENEADTESMPDTSNEPQNWQYEEETHEQQTTSSTASHHSKPKSHRL